MWPNFGDCQNCVSENDHLECMGHESDASDPDCAPASGEPDEPAAGPAATVFKSISAVLPGHGIEFEGSKAGQAEAKRFASKLEEMRDPAKLINVQNEPGVTMSLEQGHNGPYIAVSGSVRFRNITQQQFDEIAGVFCKVWGLDVEVEP